MTQEQKEFILTLFSDASQRDASQRHIQLPDAESLGQLASILALVEFRPALQSPSPNVSETFSGVSIPHQSRDFAFAQLLLFKSTHSAISESTFHDNYLEFLEKVDSESLYDEILQTTFVISKAILCPTVLSNETLNNEAYVLNTGPSSDVFLLGVLKNLGGWLGKLIITTKRFILKTDIDLKSLIIEAYEQDHMAKTIPFVLAVLESCKTSPIYQPSNPWMMTILRLLHEIYMMATLNNGLRLCLEGFLEKFSVLEHLKPTSILQKKHRNMNAHGDFNEVPQAIEVSDARGLRLMRPRWRLPVDFHVYTKTSSSCFENYPQLERDLEDVVLHVLEKTGPKLIKLAETVVYESIKAGVLMYFHHGRADWSMTKAKLDEKDEHKSLATRLAKQYVQNTGKVFLSGWISYRVGDLLQRLGVPYALQRAIVEGVIEDNLECICKKLGECAAAEASGYFLDEVTLWTSNSDTKLLDEINKEFEKGVDVDAMNNFLETVLESTEKKLAALCEAVCSQLHVQEDPPILFMDRKKIAYLDNLVKSNFGGMNLLHALENFFKNSSFPRGQEDLLVDGFLQTGYLSKEVILEWLKEGSSTRDENNFEVLESVRHLAEKLRYDQVSAL